MLATLQARKTLLNNGLLFIALPYLTVHSALAGNIKSAVIYSCCLAWLMFDLSKRDAFYKSKIALVLSITLLLSRCPDPATNVITYDTCGYYMYLPTIFYDNILQPHNVNIIRAEYNPSGAGVWEATLPVENGSQIMRYTAGMSMMYLPAFFVAHCWAKIAGYKVDGFSFPYQVCMQLWSVFIACLGLNYMRKNLLIFFSDLVARLGVLVIAFGTNFLFYASPVATMAHGYLFCLYAMLIWYTQKAYTQQKTTQWFLVGLIISLIILCRPMEAVCVFVPLLWGLAIKKPGSEAGIPIKESIAKMMDWVLIKWVAVSIVIAIMLLYIVDLNFVSFLLKGDADRIKEFYPTVGKYFIPVRSIILYSPYYFFLFAAMLVALKISALLFRYISPKFSLLIDKRFIVAIIPFVILCSLQLLYWKLASGNWFVHLYRNPDDYLETDLHMAYTLFSWDRGWLMYSPLFLLAFPGFYLIYKKYNQIFLAIIVPVCLQTIITFSFHHKDFGGGIGHRNFVSVYPLWIFATVASISYLLMKNKVVTYALLGILCWISFTFNVSSTPQTGLSKQEYLERIGRLCDVRFGRI